MTCKVFRYCEAASVKKCFNHNSKTEREGKRQFVYTYRSRDSGTR